MRFLQLFALAAIMFCSSTSLANTVLGGNITWTCLGDDQYQIQLTSYLDCYGYDFSGSGIPPVESVFLFPNGSCGASIFQANLNYVGYSQISDLCPSEMSSSSCSGGAIQGVAQFVYSGVVTLAPGCSWDIVWSSYYWSYFKNANEFYSPVYISSTIDTNYPCYSSPTIVSNDTHPQVPYLCVNVTETHEIQLANTTPGHTYHYTILANQVVGASIFDDPTDATGWTMPPGLGAPTPAVSSGGTQITFTNPSTATLTNNGIRVQIEIYDENDNLIGIVNEHMVFHVRDCALTETQFNDPVITTVGPNTMLTGGNQVAVCAGDSLIFTVGATNANTLRSITISETNTPLPFSSEQQGQNPAYKTYKLLTSEEHIGTYTFNLHAEDNACPIPDMDDATVTITIYENLRVTFSDTTICDGQTINLHAEGLTTPAYNWSVISGETFSPVPNAATQTVSPGETTTYLVSTTSVPASCHASDTVTVRVLMTDLTYTKTDETCDNNNGSIDLTIHGEPSNNLSYNWSPVSGGIVNGQQDQTGLNGGTSYTVTVTDTVYGCTLTETIAIADIPSPVITLSADTTICEGDCANIVLTLTQGTAPFSFTGVNFPDPTSNVPASQIYSVCPTSTTTYSISEIVDASNCTTTVSQSVTVTVRERVTAAFDPAGPICLGDDLQLNLMYSPAGGSYNVNYTITDPNGTDTPMTLNNFNGGTVNVTVPTVAGNYTYDIDQVSYTSGPACPSSDSVNASVTVVVNPLPTVTVNGDMSICSGQCADLQLTLTGTGPWLITYTENGTSYSLNIPTANYTFSVCPLATTTYCFTAVQDANCSSGTISGQCATVTVTPVPTLTSYTLSETDICEGQDATLTVNYGPAAQTACLYFSATPSDLPAFAPPFCSQSSSAAFTSLVSPETNTVYCLDSIAFVRPDGGYCPATFNVCRTLNVHGDITVTQTNIECNNISTQYRVTFNLSDGVAPYNEATHGPITDTTFTSQWVDSGTSASWSFTDVHACNTVTMNANHTCPVLTNAGTMVDDPQSICGDGAVTAVHNGDEFLDGNDALMYILYSNAASPLAAGSVIQQNCNAPIFSFDENAGMTYGTTYYIAAVAGDESTTTGCVNLSAANVQVSNGTPVVWYQTPTAALSASGATSACFGNCVTLNVTLTGQGPWNITYTVDGAPGALSPITVPANATLPYSFCSNEDGVHELTGISSGVAANVCVGTVSGSVDVIIHPLPTANFNGDAHTCFGTTNCFEINLTGAAPWTLTIDNPGANDDVIPNIAATPYSNYCVGAGGSYQIISVTDANNCTNTTPSTAVTLTIDPLPIVQWVQGDTSFCEASNIVLNYAISGGSTAPYTINYNVPDPDIATPATNAPAIGSITIDVPGVYEITSVTDANGCVSAAPTVINVTEIATPIANAGPDLDQCIGLPITIGTPAITGQTYTWSSNMPPLPNPANVAEPIVTVTTVPATAIEYIVTAHVAQCSASDTMLLTIHGLPAVSITTLSDSLCYSACTDLQANGNSNLTYTWTVSSSISEGSDLNSSTVHVCPASNETFTVTAFEVHGNATCSNTATIQITVADSISVNENFTEQLCFGSCSGEIHLTASGGFAPYTLDPTSNVTAWDMTNLCPGNYIYNITDAIGCVYSDTIVILERDPEVITLADITLVPPTCAYDLGSIQVNKPYTTYQLSNPDCEYTANPSSLTTGEFLNVPPCDTDYTLLVTFMVSPTESCTTSTTIGVHPLSPAITFNEVQWDDNIFCYNEQACFTANPTGGTAPLNISWHSCSAADGTCIVTDDDNYCINITEDVTLYGVVTDANNCRSNVVMMAAELAPEIFLNLQNGLDSIEICEFDCVDLNAIVSGGNGNVQVTWTQAPNHISLGNVNPLHICPLVNTTYHVVASDGCSQEKTDSIYVVVHDTPNVIIDSDVIEGCYPQTVNFIDLSDPITDDFTCVWNFGTGQPQALCGDNTFTYPNYGVFYPVYTITTEHGCVGSDTLDSPITIYGKPAVGFTWEPEPVTVINNRVQFVNTTLAGDTYLWTVQGVGTSVQKDPLFVLPPRDQYTYEVCLEATTIHGCKDTICQDVFMETVLQVYVPNAFTPDPDDEVKLNDVFLPIVSGHDPDRYKIWIMNRWGDTVFYSENSEEPWTGEYMHGQHFVPDGTYIWHIECYELGSTNLQVFEGTVTIIR
ncbi:MAG TPA: gliding motility-associated C-terminal domain-containing protein [Flavobacteriales bacterium]